MNKKITFKELANKSRVSIGTLSRYFNNGPISEKNKKCISENIQKYDFVKNSAAARVKGSNNELIILRTVIKSETLDNIISGIIENISSNVIVKYSGQDESNVISVIEETISESPKFLVIFAPINVSNKFNEVIKKASNYSKVVVYNYKTSYASNICVSYEDAFLKIKKEYKKINFVYNDIENVETFKNRIASIEKIGIKINISKNISTNYINFYQSQNLYRNISHTTISDSILISYREPIRYSKKVEWVFVDQYFIGVCIAKLCIEKEVKQIEIIAKYIKDK